MLYNVLEKTTSFVLMTFVFEGNTCNLCGFRCSKRVNYSPIERGMLSSVICPLSRKVFHACHVEFKVFCFEAMICWKVLSLFLSWTRHYERAVIFLVALRKIHACWKGFRVNKCLYLYNWKLQSWLNRIGTCIKSSVVFRLLSLASERDSYMLCGCIPRRLLYLHGDAVALVSNSV